MLTDLGAQGPDSPCQPHTGSVPGVTREPVWPLLFPHVCCSDSWRPFALKKFSPVQDAWQWPSTGDVAVLCWAGGTLGGGPSFSLQLTPQLLQLYTLGQREGLLAGLGSPGRVCSHSSSHGFIHLLLESSIGEATSLGRCTQRPLAV